MKNNLDKGQKSSYNVVVDWHSQDGLWWNETCALVVEVFGLPGNRYTYVPDLESMTFKFDKEHDAMLCKMLLSERL